MIGTLKEAGISGPYRISGKFLLLPISGSGHSTLTLGYLIEYMTLIGLDNKIFGIHFYFNGPFRM